MRARGKALTLVMLVACTPAQSGMVIRCSPPEGPVVEYGRQKDIQGNEIRGEDDGFVEGRDGYQQVWPTFILDENNPDTLWSLWGSTVPPELTKSVVESISPTKMKKTVIILNSPTMLISIEIYPEQAWLNSFYPKLGVAYFTRHKRNDLLNFGEIVSASVMYSSCDFNSTR